MVKKIILIGVLVLCFSYAKSQNVDWLYRTLYVQTDSCVDSTHCYTQVKVKVNANNVPDSMLITVSVGTSYGANNLFGLTIQNIPSEFNIPEVEEYEDNILTLQLGEFIIDSHFFVKTTIE